MIMKRNIIIGIVVVLIVSAGILYSNYNANKNQKRVVFALSESNFDYKEFKTPKNMLEEHGVKVTLASTVIGEIKDSRNNNFQSGMLIKDVNIDDYDMLIIVGGDGMVSLTENQDLRKLLQVANEKNKYIGAICYGPVIVAKSGVLDGKEATVWFNPNNKKALEDNGAIIKFDNVVVSGNVCTAANPYVTQEFAETILQLLEIEK